MRSPIEVLAPYNCNAMLLDHLRKKSHYVLLSPQSKADSYVYEVIADPNDLIQDTDWVNNPNSLYSTKNLVVTNRRAGKIKNWREQTKVVGPYQQAVNSHYVYDSFGYIDPPSTWLDWGYTKDQFKILRQWFPIELIWENTRYRKLFVAREEGLVPGIRQCGFEPRQTPLEQVTDADVQRIMP